MPSSLDSFWSRCCSSSALRPVLLRSSARSNEDATSVVSSVKSHESHRHASSHGHQPLIERAARNCLGQSLRSVGGTRRGLVGAHARDHHGYEYHHLSLFALSFKVFDVHKSFPRDSGESGLFVPPRFGVCTHSFSRLTNSCYTHRDV